MARSKVTSASLTSDDGAAIPVSVADTDSPNAPYLQGGFALLPRQGLLSDSGYSFSARGYVDYQRQALAVRGHFAFQDRV